MILLFRTECGSFNCPCGLQLPAHWRAITSVHFYLLITLCMKLSWFHHTNGGQLFCNCPLFVIALAPGLFFGGKPDEMCCHSVVEVGRAMYSPHQINKL